MRAYKTNSFDSILFRRHSDDGETATIYYEYERLYH